MICLVHDAIFFQYLSLFLYQLAEASENEPDDSEGNEAEREEVDTDPVAQAKGDAITTEAKPDIVPTEKSDTEETSTPTGVFEPPLASTAKKEGGGIIMYFFL